MIIILTNEGNKMKYEFFCGIYNRDEDNVLIIYKKTRKPVKVFVDNGFRELILSMDECKKYEIEVEDKNGMIILDFLD